jgi:hypothetical protein
MRNREAEKAKRRNGFRNADDKRPSGSSVPGTVAHVPLQFLRHRRTLFLSYFPPLRRPSCLSFDFTSLLSKLQTTPFLFLVRTLTMYNLLLVYTFICSIFTTRHATAFVAGRPTRARLALVLAYNNNPNSVTAIERPSSSTENFLTPHKQSPSELYASSSDVATLGLKVYCDLDGVLADFEKGVVNLLGTRPSNIVKGTMWKNIARSNAFYENLDWTRDGQELWNAIQHLQPDILTGVPYPKSSRIQKFNWCKQKLGSAKLHHVDMASGYRDHEPVNGNLPEEGVTNVITCWSNNKFRESSYGS